MRVNNLSLENNQVAVDFPKNQVTSQSNIEPPPFFKVTLFVSDESLLIRLTSLGFDTAKVVHNFISIDEYVSQCAVSERQSESIITGLKFTNTFEYIGFKAKQFVTTENIYMDAENTYDISFQDSDELAVSEVYDRLLFAIGSLPTGYYGSFKTLYAMPTSITIEQNYLVFWGTKAIPLKNKKFQLSLMF